MGAGGVGQDEYFKIDRDVAMIERYAELAGDTVERVKLTEHDLENIKDPRIVILRAAGVGVYVKEVGIMISENRYVLYNAS